MNKIGNSLRRLPWQRSVAAAVALALSATAMAQSNAVGTIFGSGDAGSKVVITNTATGVSRTVTVESSGRFQVPSLPIGTYKVEMQKDGRTVQTRDAVAVNIGAGSEVSFGTELEEVVVSGGKPLVDVSATDTRSVFTAEDLQNVSVKRSIEDVALLAPGTVRGDPRYNGNRGQASASFGGSGANENAFYINGYAVTDPVKGLGSSSLPFEGIAQYQLLTGGYGAEFGRSTGGVVNIVTKSGTNDWVAGVQMSWQPDSLSERVPDIYYEKVGSTRDGRLWNQASKRRTDILNYSMYLGGPVIEDKLFFYVAAELENRQIKGPANFTGRGTAATDGPLGWNDRDINTPRWLAKVDYNIAEGHTLELTGISDVKKESSARFGYYYPLGTPVPTSATNPDRGLPLLTKGTNQNGGYEYRDGGELYIAKYTGALTENLIFTALYGHQRNKHTALPFGYDPSVVPVRDNRGGSPVFFGSYATLAEPFGYDKSLGYRFDLEWILGRHDIRAGYDLQNQAVKDGTVTAGPGGYFWSYESVGAANANNPIPGAGGARGPGGNGDYVTKSVTANGGIFTTDQYAYFLEDRWQITDRFLVSLGIRNENFKNYNSDKVVFLDQTNQWAPRFGVSWDVFGDSSLRAFANAGRYHLAIPLNLAFRQVGGSTNTDEYFKFTSIDPNTGVPQGLTALGNGPYAPNNEYGQARDPLSAAAQGLKPYFQDELAFGVEGNVFAGMKAGARITYRKLKSQLDDNCDGRPAYNWAVKNGKGSGVDVADVVGGGSGPNGLDDRAEEYWLQLSECRIINPGRDNTIRFSDPVTGNPVLANIPAAEWGLPKLKRIYKGLDLFLEHPFRNKWYGKIDYTLSKSTGNAEGMLYSDSGQADVAVTANWDHPELMVGADGPLPNDRRHQIKALGFYQFTPEWRVSATLTSASGRPRSPLGFYGGSGILPVQTLNTVPAAQRTADYIFQNYVSYPGPYYHYLNSVLQPRGSAGRLPWTTVLDLGVNYAPDRFGNKLKLGLDVFNVFNTKEVQARMEDGELGAAGNPYHSYTKILSYNAPRTVRFTVRYDWGAE